MATQIVVDSCCDLTPELREEMAVTSVPLTMLIGQREFLDDENLDLGEFMDTMKRSKARNGSAAPSPWLFQQAIEKARDAFVVTLSSRLSASYSNAVLGAEDACKTEGVVATVFDSKSATAGETLITLKLHELITGGMSRENIVDAARRFIDGMKTYFVLENYDNLSKNGRMSKVTGTLAQVLNIKLIMGADPNGEIKLFAKCRGINKMLSHLLGLISESGKDTRNETAVITHCNNPSLAAQLKQLIKERFQFKKIYVIPSGGLSSLYTDDKGIVLAF